jgi:hypothetical protein
LWKFSRKRASNGPCLKKKAFERSRVTVFKGFFQEKSVELYQKVYRLLEFAQSALPRGVHTNLRFGSCVYKSPKLVQNVLPGEFHVPI